MKKLFEMIKLRVHRKRVIMDTLVNSLADIDTVLACKGSAAGKIELIQTDMFLTKVNLKWLTGAITRDEYEDIYLKSPHTYIPHTESIRDIIKNRRR